MYAIDNQWHSDQCIIRCRQHAQTSHVSCINVKPGSFKIQISFHLTLCMYYMYTQTNVHSCSSHNPEHSLVLNMSSLIKHCRHLSECHHTLQEEVNVCYKKCMYTRQTQKLRKQRITETHEKTNELPHIRCGMLYIPSELHCMYQAAQLTELT